MKEQGDKNDKGERNKEKMAKDRLKRLFWGYKNLNKNRGWGASELLKRTIYIPGYNCSHSLNLKK